MTGTMTDAALALLPVWGGWLIFAATYLSCVALPIPASLMMLGGGAFAASGDLTMAGAALPAYAGAVLGDQTGYAIGRRGGAALLDRLRRRRSAGGTFGRAEAMLTRFGGVAVFLTRWLFAPLGPWVNFIGGAAGLRWRVFTLGSLGGELVWVALYTGLGFFFAGRIAMIADLAGSLAGLLAAAAVTLLLGWAVFRRRTG